jgi:nucleoside-diphosphate-sugar epimerase
MIKIKVVIFGATGMVGEGVLMKALANTDVESVLVIGRKPSGMIHDKLKEIVHNDFLDFTSIETQLSDYNACFFCLGVSSLGMNEKDYTLVTYNITMQAAESLSKLNKDMTFCYVSGQGTDSSEKGRLMWTRVKGKTENDLLKLPFKAVYNFRPGFIKPVKGQIHAYKASKVAAIFYPLMMVLIPKFVCNLDDLGLAMIQVVKAGYEKNILENIDITKAAVREVFN